MTTRQRLMLQRQPKKTSLTSQGRVEEITIFLEKKQLIEEVNKWKADYERLHKTEKEVRKGRAEDNKRLHAETENPQRFKQEA